VIAQRFAADGAEVLLVGRTVEQLERNVRDIRTAGGEAWLFRADVSLANEVDALIDAAMSRWARIDVLINNAGIIEEATSFLELAERDWDLVVDTNLKGYFLVGQRVGRTMASAKGGVVVNVASIDGLGYDGSYTAYQCSKAGIMALTRAMAVELAPHLIRVNAISPGYVYTDMMEREVGSDGMAYLTDTFKRVPLRRMVDAREVAATCAFLASDEASGITGQNLVVDCGLTANLYILETMPDQGLSGGRR
jgi:NAD(P)-dependent dehydrogenase (short-subunit alcohol dehydrogenase family)